MCGDTNHDKRFHSKQRRGEAPTTSGAKRRCGICRKPGHNRRTCRERTVDHATRPAVVDEPEEPYHVADFKPLFSPPPDAAPMGGYGEGPVYAPEPAPPCGTDVGTSDLMEQVLQMVLQLAGAPARDTTPVSPAAAPYPAASFNNPSMTPVPAGGAGSGAGAGAHGSAAVGLAPPPVPSASVRSGAPPPVPQATTPVRTGTISMAEGREESGTNSTVVSPERPCPSSTVVPGTPGSPAAASTTGTATAVLLQDRTIESTRLQCNTEEPLGSGAFGTVYRAVLKGKDGKPDRPVAVKKLNVQRLMLKQRRALEKEAKALAIVSGHPNVLEFVGHCSEKGKVAVVTELVDGGNLESFLFEDEHLVAPHDRKQLALDVACGMKHLHSVRTVHRDLKPANSE